MTSPPCAFAHRLFPDLRRRCSKHPVGPSTPGRRRTCPPRTALPSRPLGYDRRPVEEQDVLVGKRSPRSAWTSAVGRWRPPGGPSMSIALTLGPIRRCMPMRNRKIPPFPFGLLDVGVLNVSTVDTGPPKASAPPHENLTVNNADAAASRVGCCGVGGRLDVVEGGVQPRVTWRARGSPGGGSAWWRSAGGSP